MFRRQIAILVGALCVGGIVAAAQAPLPGQPAALPTSGEGYLWHGEVVSLDTGTRALTLKTRALGDAAAEVARFNAGDVVLLTWSGHDIRAGAVRRVAKYETGQQIVEFFALPVELGSRDVQGEYLTVRIRVPEASLAAIKGVQPGEWVTVVTRQRPKADADAIVAVQPYVRSER